MARHLGLLSLAAAAAAAARAGVSGGAGMGSFLPGGQQGPDLSGSSPEIASLRRFLQSTDTPCTAQSLDSRFNYYFDIASLSCTVCDAGQTASADGLYCICDAQDPCPSGTSPAACACRACDATTEGYPTEDGTQCMRCGSSTNLLANGPDDCSCPENQVVVEFDAAENRLATKECLPCRTFTYANPANQYECLACPLAEWASAGFTSDPCACAAAGDIQVMDGVQFGQCYSESTLKDEQAGVSAAIRDKYDEIEMQQVQLSGDEETSFTVVSHTFKTIFYPAVVWCLRAREVFGTETAAGVSGASQLQATQGCQALANLCVLENYDLDKQGGVCELFLEDSVFQRLALSVNGQPDWKLHMPWLFMDKGIRQKNDNIRLNIGFEENIEDGVVSRLDFKV